MVAYGVGRCVVVGESTGAAVAMQAVPQQPERFEGLVSLDGGAGVQVPGSATAGSGIGLPSTWPGADFRARMRWSAELCIPEPGAEHVRRWATEILLRAGPEAADRLWEALGGAELQHSSRLQEIRVPTLIIRGSEDRLTPAATVDTSPLRSPAVA